MRSSRLLATAAIAALTATTGSRLAAAGPLFAVPAPSAAEPPGADTADAVAAAADDPHSLEHSTRASFMPTGATLRQGELRVGIHELFVAEAAVGLTDQIELNTSAPLLPSYVGPGVRVGVLPRSGTLRLVLSGTAWIPIDDHETALYTGLATFAFQNPVANVHLTLGAVSDELFGKVGRTSGVISVGAVFKATPASRVAGFFELGGLGGGAGQSTANGLAFGVKVIGEHIDTDIGFLLLLLGDDREPAGNIDDEGPDFDLRIDTLPLPTLSLTYKR